MIYYFVTRKHAYTMRLFLSSWGKELAGRITVIPYPSILANRPKLPERAAAFIFSDLERLDARDRRRLMPLKDHLAQTCGPEKVLNDPLRSGLRHDVLRVLYDSGVNQFNVYPVNAGTEPSRYPVLLRRSAGHKPEHPRLLATRADFCAAARRFKWLPGLFAERIAVEFQDTKDSSGIYRKYGAFVVGDRILPRHIFFSRQWLVKEADLAEPAMLEEELEFLDTNPHADLLRDYARLLNISYGRIDYAVFDGRVQIWEINTNPSIVGTASSRIAARRPVHLKFIRMYADALNALDGGMR